MCAFSYAEDAAEVLVVGIAGASRAGKSSLCELLRRHYISTLYGATNEDNEQLISVLHQDDHFRSAKPTYYMIQNNADPLKYVVCCILCPLE
jgi:uridine kinase